MNDLISRQEALQAMDTWDKFGCDPDGKLVRYDDKLYVPYVHYEDMVHAIKHLPSAQPTADVQEVRHGHWIECVDYDGCYECSRCHDQWVFEISPKALRANYCPNCGARMEE